MDELPLLAIEVRKATKSTKSTKYGYQGGHRVSSKSRIVRKVSRCVKVGIKRKEQRLFAGVREKKVPKVSDADVG